jgi:predicted dehydrogenase
MVPTATTTADLRGLDDLAVLDERADDAGPERIATLISSAERGGAVLVAARPGDEQATALTGVAVATDEGAGEWFITLADRPEAARLDGEVALTTPLRTLMPLNGSAEVAATSSIRFEHRPVICVRPIGRGRVVTVGTMDLDATLAHPIVGTFLRRLLAAPTPRHTDDLGVAVVGYGPFGGMGYMHGLACTETDGLRLAAAVDTSPERLDAARADFPELALYGSGTQAAADPAVDVAIVATPPVHHAELALELLRAGKHVVVEKPMCLTVAQANELIRVADEHDRVITVHQSRRWDRDFLALDRAVERKLLGDVFNIETFVGGFEHPCRAWHSEDTISGGAVYDWGSHHIDWILRLYGEAPARVLCTAHNRVWSDTTNVDQLSVWMQWNDGREATFRQSDIAAIRRPKFYVQGTEGTMEGHYRPLRNERLEPGRGHLDGYHHHAEAPVDFELARYEPNYGLVTSQLPPAPHPGWGFHRNLADHLILGEPIAVRPEESRDVVAVLEAAHRSGAEGGSLIELA